MIDRQGRLFGKINVIDALIVIFLLCFFGGIIPAWWRIYHTPPPTGHQYITSVTSDQIADWQRQIEYWKKMYNEEKEITKEKIAKNNEDVKNKVLIFIEKDMRREEVFLKHPRLKKYFYDKP